MAANWTDKQKQAIYVSGRSSLVAAAAGSGKTAVLVERIIKKITDENHPVDIDRLVVVTFTKAAAAEMRQRIREALDNILESSPGNENIIRQQSLIHNAKITTIDSFCLNIVRNYFRILMLTRDFVLRTREKSSSLKMMSWMICLKNTILLEMKIFFSLSMLTEQAGMILKLLIL